VLRSGNMAKESASVTAFLAVFVMPLTSEPNCRIQAGCCARRGEMTRILQGSKQGPGTAVGRPGARQGPEYQGTGSIAF